MPADLATTTIHLTAQLRAALEPAELTVVEPLLTAFEGGGVSFDREDWHDLRPHDEAPAKARSELLLRIRDRQGNKINPAPILQVLQQKGLYPCFDQLIVLHAVNETIGGEGFPVSINISSRNACDAQSLAGLHTQLQQHFAARYRPEDIAFELLEDDAAHNPDHDALMAFKSYGYKLAIDDASHEQEDLERLRNLGPYADYVKIDGKTTLCARNGGIALGAFADYLKMFAKGAEIICEWIGSVEEAADLRDILPAIRYVQGRNLLWTAPEFQARMNMAGHGCASRFMLGPPAPSAIR